MLICSGEETFVCFFQGSKQTQQAGPGQIKIFCALCSIINLKTSEHDLRPDFQLSDQCQIKQSSTSEIKATVEHCLTWLYSM